MDILTAVASLIEVAFIDLTHTGVAVDANNNPLAVAFIAAYATHHLGNAIRPIKERILRVEMEMDE